jgi:hypothetical protein
MSANGFLEAAFYGRKEEVERMLREGIDVNVRGNFVCLGDLLYNFLFHL